MVDVAYTLVILKGLTTIYIVKRLFRIHLIPWYLVSNTTYQQI